MKNFFTLIFFLLAACTFAQRPISGPLSQNVWFDALGSREGQGWGFDFMTVLPAISDSIKHPMAISENGGANAAYILNRYPYDTTRIYTFPGGMVVPGRISGSPFTDFVCYNQPAERITVLFGTAVDSVFDTALVLQGEEDEGEFVTGVFIVVDYFDSSNVEGFVIGDPSFQDSAGYQIGRMLYYKGGNVLNQTPAEEVVGIKNQRIIGDALMSAKIRDPYHKYLMMTVYNYIHDDSLLFLLYPYGPNFTIQNAGDSIFCFEQGGEGPSIVTDVTADSIDDIVTGAGSYGFRIYAGGKNINPNPTYVFNNIPFTQDAGEFGDVMCNVGDVSGDGSDYLLVANTEEGSGGAVYLYPIGKNLRDTCLAYALGANDNGNLGATIAAVGDVNGDGLADFYVGASPQFGTVYNNCGRVIAFLGSKSYVDVVVEREKPIPAPLFLLNQNYPNPFSEYTNLSFTITDSRLMGLEATVKIFDILGRELYTAYREKADGITHAVYLDAARFHEGNYFFQLTCGDKTAKKMFTVFK